MTIAVSPILLGLAAHAGITLDRIVEPLRDRFWHDRGMPRDFRSDLREPSVAGGMRMQGERVAFPEGLPYIAGVSIGDDVRITGVELAPGALWYGDMNEAKLVLKGTSLPLSMLGGFTGRRIGEIVEHPALAEVEDVILSVVTNGGHTTFRTTTHMTRIEDPTPHRSIPRADWARELREMEEAQGLYGRIDA